MRIDNEGIEWGALFIVALAIILLLAVGFTIPDSIDRNAAYETQRLDKQIPREQRAEIVGRLDNVR